MHDILMTPLPWWIAGPALGLVIVALLGLANARFGIIGGATDLVAGPRSSPRVALLAGILLGSAVYALLAGHPDAGAAYSFLDEHLSAAAETGVLFLAGLAIGVGARAAGGCTSGHGLTGAALLSPASIASIMTIMASAIATTLLLRLGGVA